MGLQQRKSKLIINCHEYFWIEKPGGSIKKTSDALKVDLGTVSKIVKSGVPISPKKPGNKK